MGLDGNYSLNSAVSIRTQENMALERLNLTTTTTSISTCPKFKIDAQLSSLFSITHGRDPSALGTLSIFVERIKLQDVSAHTVNGYDLRTT
jgi:hypothetical protein